MVADACWDSLKREQNITMLYTEKICLSDVIVQIHLHWAIEGGFWEIKDTDMEGLPTQLCSLVSSYVMYLYTKGTKHKYSHHEQVGVATFNLFLTSRNTRLFAPGCVGCLTILSVIILYNNEVGTSSCIIPISRSQRIEDYLMTISQLNTLYTHGVETVHDCELWTQNVGSVKQSNHQEHAYMPRSQDLGFLMGRQPDWSYVLLKKKSRQLISSLLHKLWYHYFVIAKVRDWLSVSKRGMQQHYDMNRYLMLVVS
jgi:hypothetical protein